MPDYTLPVNLTNGTSGIEGIFVYEASQINIFGAGLLFMIFMVILFAGYSQEQRRHGRAKESTWFAVSGMITAFLSMVLFLMNGIVNLATVITCIVLSIIFTTIKLFDSDI